MATGRARLDWAIASSQMSLLANIHRDPKRPQFSPDQFNPLAEKQDEPVMQISIDQLKGIFGL